MPTKAVQISLTQELLRRIDQDPEAREKGRSAFVRAAIETYLRARQRQRIDDEITRAYEAAADEMLEEVADFMVDQSWPTG